MPKIEHRAVPAQFEVRASTKAGSIGTLVGMAAVFNSQSVDLGGFREFVRPGAFDEALAENQDTRCFLNHERNLLLGRVKSGTLSLRVSKEGLVYENELPGNDVGERVKVSVDRGDLDGCSFSFSLRSSKGKPGDNWYEEKEQVFRELLNLNLIDVGPVSLPAYEATSVSARSAEEAGELLQAYRDRVASASMAGRTRYLQAQQRQIGLLLPADGK